MLLLHCILGVVRLRAFNGPAFSQPAASEAAFADNAAAAASLLPASPPPPQQALHLLAAMCEGGATLAPDGVSYNTAIKACAAACQVGQALEVYRQMVGR